MQGGVYRDPVTTARAAAACVLLAGASAWAHYPDKVLQETRLTVAGPRLSVEYLTTFGPVLSSMWINGIDVDGDGRLSGVERAALLRTWSEDVCQGLAVRLDRTPLPLAFVTGAAAVQSNGDLLMDLLLEADLPSMARRSEFEVEDRNHADGVLGAITYSVRASPGARTAGSRQDGRRLTWTVERSDGAVVDLPDRTGTPPPAAVADGNTVTNAAPAVVGDAEPSERLAGLLREGEPRASFVLGALIVALGLGALHAFGPGHGKAMVAAYLIGSRGRVRDAVTLGGVVTLAHVGSVIVLGLVALFLSEYVLPQQLYPWLGVASGVMIWLVGFWMLARRALHEHGHTHDHGPVHDPGHGHVHSHAAAHVHGPGEASRATRSALLMLGVSGGMVPCPSALAVLLGAVAMHRIAFGLALIVAFSAGLALVLILVGVLVVTSSGWALRGRASPRWVSALPVFSAGVVMAAGTVVVVQAMASAGWLAAIL